MGALSCLVGVSHKLSEISHSFIHGWCSDSECLISSTEKQTKAMYKLPFMATKFRTVTMTIYAKISLLLHTWLFLERKKEISIHTRKNTGDKLKKRLQPCLV